LIEGLLQDVCDWYNMQSPHFINIPALASQLQKKIVSIHPFDDKNGGLSRVILTWVLENNGFPSSIIERS